MRWRARRVTFRMGKEIFILARDVSGRMASSLAELCQAMILIGMVYEYVQFEDSTHLREFVSATRNSKLADRVDEENPLKKTLMSLSRSEMLLVSGLTCNRPHIEGSELMKVRLPSRLVKRIDLYAKLTNATRSSLLTKFFQTGLLLHIRSQTALMSAIAKSLSGMKTNPRKTQP